MFNLILNRLVDASTARTMKKYMTYPAAQTAIVFINVQQALMVNQQELASNLERLQELARTKKFRIIHAPYGAVSQQHYPSPAQTQLTQLLEATPDGREKSPKHLHHITKILCSIAAQP